MKKEKKINFEESMIQLENIVKSLESGDSALEENLQLFEKGVELSKALQFHLNSAEQRIKVLSKTGESEDLAD